MAFDPSAQILDPVLGGQRFFWPRPKPSFKYSDEKNIVITATENAPQYFVIGGRIRIILSNLKCNLASSGIGGLATGLTLSENVVYYLYAVDDDGDVGLVADDRDPSLGCRESSEWTYLGSFGTQTSAALTEFVSSGGVYLHGTASSSYDVTVTNATPLAAYTLLVPPTAKSVELHLRWAAVNAIGDALTLSPNANTGLNHFVATSVTASQNPRIRMRFPLVESQTIYAFVTTVTTDSVSLRVVGWTEDPMEYP